MVGERGVFEGVEYARICSREEFDKIDLNESSSLLNQLVYTSDGRKVSCFYWSFFDGWPSSPSRIKIFVRMKNLLQHH